MIAVNRTDCWVETRTAVYGRDMFMFFIERKFQLINLKRAWIITQKERGIEFYLKKFVFVLFVGKKVFFLQIYVKGKNYIF